MPNAADQVLIDKFLDALWLEKGLSENTLKSYRYDLAAYAAWLFENNWSIADVRRADINLYLSYRL